MLIELEKFHKDIDGFLFAIRAIGNNHTHLFISKNIVMGTNGSRIHRYQAKGKYQPGLYRVFKATTKHIILYKTKLKLSVFPDTKDIFARKEKVLEHLQFKQHFPGPLAEVIRAIDGKSTVNPNYLKDLGSPSFDLYIDGPRLVFDAYRHIAVIMTMRM